MISVDSVYQKVLAIANKEQRGYITPQEFNLFANQAQLDIFEQYFYDLDQFSKIPGNDTTYTDIVTIIEDKIHMLADSLGSTAIANLPVNGANHRITLPGNIYRIIKVECSDVEAEKLNTKDFTSVKKQGPLIRPTATMPVYNLQDDQLKIYNGGPVHPGSINCGIYYIRKPLAANWTYVVLNNKALYNSSALDLQNFELHSSEETELVLKILTLAGISNGTDLYQIGSMEDKMNIKQEKPQ